MSFGNIRADFPSLSHCTHLNSGGMAPMPAGVVAELLRIPQHVAEFGPTPLLAHEETYIRTDAAHHAVADLLGVEEDEVAFTTQFSTGVSLVVEGLTWRAGDEIVVPDQEHPALLTPLLNIARRRDLVVRRVPIVPDREAFLADFAAAAQTLNTFIATYNVHHAKPFTWKEGVKFYQRLKDKFAQAAGEPPHSPHLPHSPRQKPHKSVVGQFDFGAWVGMGRRGFHSCTRSNTASPSATPTTMAPDRPRRSSRRRLPGPSGPGWRRPGAEDRIRLGWVGPSRRSGR
jgi:hypothetical protein